MIAEILPDPNSFSSFGWVCVILVSIAAGVNQILKLIDRFKHKEPHPPYAAQFASKNSVNEAFQRIRALEDKFNAFIERLRDVFAGKAEFLRFEAETKEYREVITDKLEKQEQDTKTLTGVNAAQNTKLAVIEERTEAIFTMVEEIKNRK